MASRGRGPPLRVLLLLVLGAVGAAAAPGRLAIGSKSFPESRLLAEMLAQLVEARTDLVVERRMGLGGTKICFGALQAGEIDLYPEYIGTAWTVMLQRSEPVRDATRTYLMVAHEFRSRFDQEWLMPLGFDNTYALALHEDTAARLGLERISQLGPHLAELRIGFSHEFLSRGDGFPGLAESYGFAVPEDMRGMEHGLAYEGLRGGRVDLVDAYSTDGKLLRYRVRILEDDRHFFPPYLAAPLVRGETLREHPGLRKVLDGLAYALPDDVMRRLNHRVEEEGGSFVAVARDFLRSSGLLEGAADVGLAADAEAGEGGLGAYLWARRGRTLRHTAQHLRLTLLSLLLAVLVAVPLGILLTRTQALAAPVLGIAGVIQTIPGLALLAFLIPVPGLGLGERSAIVALFLYALLPILRNTYTGLREVDPVLLEAARGMGLRDRETLLRVELPLASRTIMAGVRTSGVITVGVATLAAFVGAGGLGDPILTGLQLDDTRMVLSGAIPAALLAILTDQLLGVLERRLAPAGT